MLAVAVFAVLLLVVAVGCANRRAVLYEGVHFGRGNDPRERFANLAQAELRRRLTALVGRYDFTVLILIMPRPRQLAPEVVVRTSHYVEVAQATRLILQGVDPKASTAAPRGRRPRCRA